MRNDLDRRAFLKYIGAGAAVVSIPSLAGCGSRTALCARGGKATPGAHATYFDRFGVNASTLKRVMDKGLASGGDFVDVFLQHKITTYTGLEDGQVNRAYSTIDLGAGIRVLKGDATGFAYCEDLSEKALLSAAGTAAAVADAAPQARPKSLAAHPRPNRYEIEVPWSEIGIEKKLPALERGEQTLRKQDARIIKATVFVGDEDSHILLANSDGLLIEDDQPMAIMWITCVAMDNGKVQSSSDSLSARDGLSFFNTRDVDALAVRTAERTISSFVAVPPPAGELPVVLAAGFSGILLHEAIGHGMEADFNRKGISIYSDMIGKRVAPKDVTILDDGTLPHMRGSINVDDEGCEGQATVLVENGILRSYLHDHISAKHYGVAPTGSGRRQSFRYPPVPRMRNTYMESGPLDPQEIIASVDRGIYAETFANGQVNIGAGDFTFYLEHGRLIENGKLTEVIKDVNLTGNGPKVLETIEMVGNDKEMLAGGGSCGKDGQYVPVGFGLPTCKAGAITIGGRNA